MVTAAVFAVAVTAGTLVPSTEPVSQVPTLPMAAIVAEAATEVPAAEAQLPSLKQFTLAPRSSRPTPLVPLYASLAVLQGFDIYTTNKAMARGAVEANPAMAPVAGKTWGSMAVKAAATAGSVYFIERAWKHNRKGAVILATVINVATAAVVAHNTRVAR
jgi:uncharacterized protein DUF5658